MSRRYAGMGPSVDHVSEFRRYERVRGLSRKTIDRRDVSLRQFAASIVPMSLLYATAALIDDWLGTHRSPATREAHVRHRAGAPVGRAPMQWRTCTTSMSGSDICRRAKQAPARSPVRASGRGLWGRTQRGRRVGQKLGAICEG